MKKILKKSIAACAIIGLVSTGALASPNYDEKVILGFSTAKIKLIQTDISLNYPSSVYDVKKSVQESLVENDYIKEHLKGKRGVFFVTAKKEYDHQNNEIMYVDRVYHLKNPQQFFISMGVELSDEQLADVNSLKTYLENNIKARAIISEKIDRIDRNWVRKSTEMSVNGFVGLNNICPLNPFRGLVNAVFSFFTTDAKDVYKKVLEEVELIQDGKKHYEIVVLPLEE